MPILKPGKSPLFFTAEKDDHSSHLQRQVIGYLGGLLPFALYLVDQWRHFEKDVPVWHPLDSISAYFYTGSVAIFTGVLASLAVFLLTYRGYGNAYKRQDRIAAIVAGVAAIGVAFFPTDTPPNFQALPWRTDYMGTVHFLCATTLFVSFVYFSLVLFTKKNPKIKLTPDKKRRNVIYIVCGIGMAVCVVGAGIAHLQGKPIVWYESIALWLFAISWLTKGHAVWTLKMFGKRTVYYGRNPKHLVRDTWQALAR